MTWDEAFSRLAAVRDELEAARFSLTYVQSAIGRGEMPIPPSSTIRPSHVRLCMQKAELTYVLRLFAEFEAVLRDYWHAARPRSRRRRTQMETLLNRIASDCGIPWDAAHEAHRVRNYRNAAVHDAAGGDVLTFLECKSRLGTFLSFLPVRW